MSRRSWLYGLLKDDEELDERIDGRVFGSSGMTTADTPKPYIVYHIGNDTNERLADNHPAHRIFFQVYIHDEPGDYQQIDMLGDRVISLLRGIAEPPEAIMDTKFLERSQDLSDETLRTIFQYIRFQWILSR